MNSLFCMQDLVAEWWVEEPSKDLIPGRLIWVYYPYMNIIPYEFLVQERTNASGVPDPTNHENLSFQILEFRMSQRSRARLPVSSFPKQDNEVYLITRAKKRPALVLANDQTGFKILNELKQGPKWQKHPSVIVAPFYGTAQNENRSGFHPNFIERVRQCEYPELMYDRLPINKSDSESLLYLKHMSAVGRHHETVQATSFCLSEDALILFEEHLFWYFSGVLDEESLICDFKKNFM
jgi:hypothetical protein